MHRQRVWRHRTAGVDQQSAAFVVDAPDTVDTLAHIPPADLADVVGTIPASLKVYDADAVGGRRDMGHKIGAELAQPNLRHHGGLRRASANVAFPEPSQGRLLAPSRRLTPPEPDSGSSGERGHCSVPSRCSASPNDSSSIGTVR